MARAFARIAFTPSVKAAQARYGSRDANLGFETGADGGNELTPREAQFIEARDSFYQATVSETGWPYVQHRGGPSGFLKVLDPRTIGYADFHGNVQYLSVGNLAVNDRIALILVDYPNRRRLKVWGRAQIVHESEDPGLVARLEVPTYRARIERAIVIRVEAWDWNCPQHIAPRYTEAEIATLVEPLLEENRQLKARSAARLAEPATVLGSGPLELEIAGVRQLTPAIRSYELRHASGDDLPPVEPGSHLRIPVTLPDGQAAVRHYSISSDSRRSDAYEIAVLRQEEGSGGSRFVHDRFALGTRLRCDTPRNGFLLDVRAEHVTFIAGGIGITAIRPMVMALSARGTKFHLHYAARSAPDMAYRSELRRRCGDALTVYLSDQGQRMNPDAILREAPADSLFYVCGPDRLIDAVLKAAVDAGIDPDRVRIERFAPGTATAGRPVTLHLRRSNKTVEVPGDQSLLSAVRAAGVDALSDCGVGTCGTCAVKVLEGIADHRDNALTSAERTRAGMMCICVSRAHSEELVLDL